MRTHSTLLFEVADSVATIILNRPERANALDAAMAQDLVHATIECDENPAIRAVILTGGPRFFCGGGDLPSFASHGEHLPVHVKEVASLLHTAISKLARMDPPVIAAVHGAAAGAGMSIALACDIVLAAESSRFTMAYTRIGVTPDGSASYFLARMVGLRRAMELMLTNRTLSGKEAAESSRCGGAASRRRTPASVPRRSRPRASEPPA